VQRLSGLASVLKLNEDEARTLYAQTHTQDVEFTVENFCRRWASTYNIQVICVTLGAAGCFILDQDAIYVIPGFPVTLCDTVGSGDAFAAGFLDTARFANALGALVAGRAGATPDWSIQDCFKLLETTPQST
jgi:fructokinase